MKKVKSVLMVLIMLVSCVCISSCSKDDDEPKSSLQDYYIEIDLTGGGLDASDLNEWKTDLNADISKTRWKGIDRDKAIYEFDTILKAMKDEFIDGGSGISGTLKIIFYLKTIDGDTVKKSTLSVTKDGCTLN